MATDILTPTSFSTPAFRRLQRGTRYSPVVTDPNADSNSSGSGSQAALPSLYQLDSAFQLQEYIGQLVRRDPEDVDHIVRLPGGQQQQQQLQQYQQQQHQAGDQSPLGQDVQEVDMNCWIYEHLRRLAQDLTYPLITSLQEQCTRQTCPEMKAGEWLYLCVAHGNGGAMEQCCAIDYILHTLDSATSLLNSSRTFPSRIAIPATSTKHFSSLARRLSRIFAHAYFHHRELFEEAEAQNALYERFLGLVREFDLVPSEYLVIDWEGRPARKSRSLAYSQDESSAHHGAEGDIDRDHSRQILSRHGDQSRGRGDTSLSASASASDAALTSSPSGRRRTDTMIMQGEMLAAWDEVLGGNAPFPENEDDLRKVMEADQDIAYEQLSEPLSTSEAYDAVEPEMVESVAVDPFSDDAEAPASAPAPTEEAVSAQTDYDVDLDAPAIKDEVVVLGDDVNVPDVEDVVVPVAEAPSTAAVEETESELEPAAIQGSGSDSGSSWSEVEIPAEPGAEGQSAENTVSETEPGPEPESASTAEAEAEAPKDEDEKSDAETTGTEDAQEGTTANGDGNVDVDTEVSGTADVDVIEKMLSDLEIARNAKIEVATATTESSEPTAATATTTTTDAPSAS